VQRLLARPAPLGPTAELRELVDGYVAGYNRYLRDTGVAHLPDPTCRGKAWVGLITALDVWSGIRDLNTLEGTAGFNHPTRVQRQRSRCATRPRRRRAVPQAQPNPPAGSARRWAGIALPGCPGEKGCFNVIEATGPEPGQPIGPPRGETGRQPGPKSPRPDGKPPATPIFGSSFIMAIELTPQKPRTRTMLTFSESANPVSPHHRDQTALFSRKQWVTERFTKAEINADPYLRTTTVHGRRTRTSHRLSRPRPENRHRDARSPSRAVAGRPASSLSRQSVIASMPSR
jgi:Penicillin amidase